MTQTEGGEARYEQRFFDNIVHSLRMRGMSKSDAEGIALERLIHLRDAKATPPQGDET